MTRNGKIARLPRTVRQELNRRLDDGEPGKTLVAWLNGLPEVVVVLGREFQGKAISEQNLSEWKQGGFLDWQRHQEALDCVRTAAEQAQELAEEAGPVPLTDVLSASVALLLTKLIREVESGAEATPEARRELLGLIREWTALRQGDHKAAQLKMRQADWGRERAKEADAAATAAAEAEKALAYANSPEGKIAAFDKKYQRVEHEVISEISKEMSRHAIIDSLCSGVKPEKKAWFRDHINNEIKERQEKMLETFEKDYMKEAIVELLADAKLIRPGTTGEEDDEPETDDQDGEAAENPAESDPIRPDPTLKEAA